MSLNIWALALAKSFGQDYPAFQIVFLRALVGLILMIPLIWWQRETFRHLTDLPLHLLRVTLSTIALTAGYFAIARVPIALFTTVNFIRPLLLMLMAALIMREKIAPRQWLAAVIALIGVFIAINPTQFSGGWGIIVLFLAVFAGTGATIVTRHKSMAPTVVLMTFYTAGLAAFSAPLAFATWQPISAHWPALITIGIFAQLAQFCFLCAHRHGQAAFLAILSYSSLIISTSVGFFVFEETPIASFWIGSLVVIAASLWSTLRRR